MSIETMCKQDRLCTEEIYTVGFVPSYDLPDARPNSLDPFLEPLVQDLEEGFIEGGIHSKGKCTCIMIQGSWSLYLKFIESHEIKF